MIVHVSVCLCVCVSVCLCVRVSMLTCMQLLLLWRLVSLELKLADKTGIGAGSVSAKLRELEKSLQ